MVTDRAIALEALKDAMVIHQAHARWYFWCDGKSAAMVAAGVYELEEYPHGLALAVERTYEAACKMPAMPSKVKKLQMYSDIRRAARLVGLEVESLSTFSEIAELITRVVAELAKSSI